MAFRDFCHLLGLAFGHHLAAAVATLGANINDMICGFHHIQVVFDHNDRIALINQLMQYFEQFAHIFKMQTRGRFIQNI